MDCGSPGSSVHRIFQARILEWLPFPPSGDLSNPGIKPASPALQADSLPLGHLESPKSCVHLNAKQNSAFHGHHSTICSQSLQGKDKQKHKEVKQTVASK